MRAEFADRINVSPTVHDVLDAVEHLHEGPLARTGPGDAISEIVLVSDTLFSIALGTGPAGERDADKAERMQRQAQRALRHPSAQRLAALLLMAMEMAVPSAVPAFSDAER